MIRYLTGNLVDARADALVNTVNEVGVMGKGIALQFRDAFPESAAAYERAAKAHEIGVGKMFVTYNPSFLGPRIIIHFPTKKHWRQPSQMAWIQQGLTDLRRVIKQERITSIALPPLGCGNGGLHWPHVKRAIESSLGGLGDVDILVYEPTSNYHNAPKRSGTEELTPARALVAELVRRYSVLGLECSVLEVQKLAWVLSRAVFRSEVRDPLALRFIANKYGPYADNLRFLLDQLDGSFLHCERRLADARPLDAIWFEDEKAADLQHYLASDEAAAYQGALQEALAVIDGFESPLGMELLATVDWLVHREGVAPTIPDVRRAVAEWPAGTSAARRKQLLFDERLIGIALERLTATLFQPKLA